MTEKYSKDIAIVLDEVKIVEPKKQSQNFEGYRGKKVKIAKVEVKEEINFYPDGLHYDANATGKCFKCYLISEPLKALDENENFMDELVTFLQEDGTVKNLIVRARFGLNTGPDGKPEISKHTKGKLWAAMRKLGANTLGEIIGKIAMLDLEPSKIEGDDKKYLRLAL